MIHLFFARVSITSFVGSISYVLKYLLTFPATTTPRYMVGICLNLLGFLLALLDNRDTGVFLKMARWTYGDIVPGS